MTPDLFKAQLQERVRQLDAAGARVGRSHPTLADRELALHVAVLNRGRHQPGTARTATRQPAATRRVRVQHATSPLTGPTPLYNVSDIGGYYRRTAANPQAYEGVLTMSRAHQ